MLRSSSQPLPRQQASTSTARVPLRTPSAVTHARAVGNAAWAQPLWQRGGCIAAASTSTAPVPTCCSSAQCSDSSAPCSPSATMRAPAAIVAVAALALACTAMAPPAVRAWPLSSHPQQPAQQQQQPMAGQRSGGQTSAACAAPLADVAGLFGMGADDDRDPVEVTRAPAAAGHAPACCRRLAACAAACRHQHEQRGCWLHAPAWGQSAAAATNELCYFGVGVAALLTHTPPAACHALTQPFTLYGTTFKKVRSQGPAPARPGALFP